MKDFPEPDIYASAATRRACRLVLGHPRGSKVVAIKVTPRELHGLKKYHQDTTDYGWWAPSDDPPLLFGVPVRVVQQ